MAKRRAQEKEAWRSVKAAACSVLEQLQHVGTVALKDLVLQSLDTTQERWIALQFLGSLTLIVSELSSWTGYVSISCSRYLASILLARINKDENTHITIELCTQERWSFMSCFQPLKPGAGFGSITVQMGIPISKFEEHPRLAELKEVVGCYGLILLANVH
jgi:hypothetical protein